MGKDGPRLLLLEVLLLQPHDQDSVCTNFKVPRYYDRPTNSPTLGSAPQFSFSRASCILHPIFAGKLRLNLQIKNISDEKDIV
jgi:hypothetical protein